MTPDERDQLERDGWHLLLWSYRHELEPTDTTPRPDQDQDRGPHRE